MGLTAIAIKSAKGREKQYKLADSDGLYLLVATSGGRYWRMNYRYDGKFKTLAFGVWPETGLADARAKRDGARQLLAKGVDPADQAMLDKIAAHKKKCGGFMPCLCLWPAWRHDDRSCRWPRL